MHALKENKSFSSTQYSETLVKNQNTNLSAVPVLLRMSKAYEDVVIVLTESLRTRHGLTLPEAWGVVAIFANSLTMTGLTDEQVLFTLYKQGIPNLNGEALQHFLTQSRALNLELMLNA